MLSPVHIITVVMLSVHLECLDTVSRAIERLFHQCKVLLEQLPKVLFCGPGVIYHGITTENLAV